MQAPDRSRPFVCHTDASELPVGGSLTQNDANSNPYVVSYFYKRISEEEENYAANNGKLLGLVYFLKRFRLYLEGS